MEIIFKCLNPSCEQKLSVPVTQAGKLHRCSHCQTEQIVPSLEYVLKQGQKQPSGNTGDGQPREVLVPLIQQFALHFYDHRRAYVLFSLFIFIVVINLQFNAHTQRNTRVKKMANELSAIGEFRMAPEIDHENSRLIFARNASTGVDITLVDLTSLRSIKLTTASIAESGQIPFNLIGWSPDDHFLAYSVATDTHNSNHRVQICSGRSGVVLQAFDVPSGIRDALWLSEDELLLFSGHGELYRFYATHAQTPGKPLPRPELLASFPNANNISSLCKIDDDCIAYLDDSDLWEFRLAQKSKRWLAAIPAGEIEWMDYSQDQNAFLFCRNDTGSNNHRELYRLDINQKQGNQLQQISPAGGNVLKGQWVLQGKGYAYVDNIGNQTRLTVKSGSGMLETNLFETGYVRSYSVSPKRDKLYAVAATRFEPLSIIEYDLTSKKLRTVVDSGFGMVRQSKTVEPIISFADSLAHSRVIFHEIPPVKFSPDKRYPLVIDGSPSVRWDSYSQFMANIGIYYVSVRQWTDSAEDSPEALLAVYNEMSRKPYIDMSRVYLSGFSASTIAASKLAEKHPEYWRGIILNNPTALPKIQGKNHVFPDIFISVGFEEVGMNKTLQNFESDACASLIRLDIVREQSQGHIFNSTKSVEDRYLAVSEFIQR